MSRDRVLSVRLSAEEYRAIAAEAAANRITSSEWLRRAVAREIQTLDEIRRIRGRRISTTGRTVGSSTLVEWRLDV